MRMAMRFGVYSKAEIEVNGETADMLREIEAASIDEAKDMAESLEEEEPEVVVVPLCPNCERPLIEIRFEERGSVFLGEEGEYKDADQTSGTFSCCSCGNIVGGYGQGRWGFIPNFR